MGFARPFTDKTFFDDGTGFIPDMVGEGMAAGDVIGVSITEGVVMTAYVSISAGSTVLIKYKVKGSLIDTDIEWTLAEERGAPPVLTKRHNQGIAYDSEGNMAVTLIGSETKNLQGLYSAQLKIRQGPLYLADFTTAVDIKASSGGEVE